MSSLIRCLKTSAAASLLSLSLLPVIAEPLVINNPSFEADEVADNTFPIFLPTGWSPYDPFGLQGGNVLLGVLNPTNSTFFPDGAPDGSNVALVWVNAQFGLGEFGLQQELSATLEPGVYTLRVWVGNIDSGTGSPPFDQFGFFDLSGFPGYAVRLLAGDTVIAEDDNTLTTTLDNGEFDESIRQVVISADDPLLDVPMPPGLTVRLINLNLQVAQDNAIEVDFDDVRLCFQATDASSAVSASGCIGGPGTSTGPCPVGDFTCADLDLDGDVDIQDHAELATLIGK
jgi:hypothetical protein